MTSTTEDDLIRALLTLEGGPENFHALRAAGAPVSNDALMSYVYDRLSTYGEFDDAENTKLLLEAGASTKACSEWGWGPLTVAAHYGDLAWVKVLVEHGAQLDEKTTESSHPYNEDMRTKVGFTPMHAAKARLKDPDPKARANAKKIVAYFESLKNQKGVPSTKPDTFDPLDHPGFNRETQLFLVAGREITAPTITRSDVEKAVMAVAALQASFPKLVLRCLMPADLSPYEESKPSDALPYSLIIGGELAQASANHGVKELPPSFASTANALSGNVPSEIFKLIAKALPKDAVIASKNSLWLVATGPLSTGQLMYGRECDGDDESEGKLSVVVSLDQRQETSGAVKGITVCATESASRVTLTEKSVASHASSAAAKLKKPRYYLVPRYD